MKIKQIPDDFQVDELTDFAPSSGPFALYCLEKTGWTTHDAVNTVCRLWQLVPRQVSFGGLKDRHAHTKQFLTIENGPPEGLQHRELSLTYLGQVSEPFESKHIRANRFVVVVRDLSPEHAERALNELDCVRRDGVANYFDDQRFGSVSDGGFIAKYMVLGEWETALKLALTAPYEFDRSAAKKEKAILRQHWGNWREVQRKLPRTQRKLVDFLVKHPTDFFGAIQRLRADLSGMYLSAYQSHLWNQFLARWLTKNVPATQRVDVGLKLDRFPMPRHLTDALRDQVSGWTLPLPSARLKFDELIPDTPPDWPEVLRDTLAVEGIELDGLKLRGMRRPFFSRGERAILFRPENLSAESAADERHPHRHRVAIRFELPRGCYATLLVKRITETTEN